MHIQELPAKDFLAHLRRHPLPELMDVACLSALASVEAQYGGTITHGAGLEVRLGEEARYVDYIMNIDEAAIPGVQSLWYEIDYAAFRKASETGENISPCLFANTCFKRGDKAAWDAFLPSFLGEARAKRLRPAFDRVVALLPQGAHVKQVGTMTGRGELSVMRLVMMFPAWDAIPGGLLAIGWQGDAAALRDALEPWKETDAIAVNIDLGEMGVLPKIGVEVFSRWRHPLLVDKFIARLEAAGLCLPAKGAALRRWTRLLPDGDPFIQTLIAYFKLNYRDGRITEAKAYLEQSPYTHHHYFCAYDRPVRLDVELYDERTGTRADADSTLARIPECAANRVRHLRIYGGETCVWLERLMAACREHAIRAELVLAKPVSREWLRCMVEARADAFLIDVNDTVGDKGGDRIVGNAGDNVTGNAGDNVADNAGEHVADSAGDNASENTDGNAADNAGNTLLQMAETLRQLGAPLVRMRWHLHGANAAQLPHMLHVAEGLGVHELIITGMKPDSRNQTHELPSHSQLIAAAQVIENWRKNHADGEVDCALKVTVESCFSPLRALLGGSDARTNDNRGIGRGCEAGRAFIGVRADGSFTPCLRMAHHDKPESIATYWQNSPAITALRAAETGGEVCQGCPYARRCLPCPVVFASGAACPLHQPASTAGGTCNKP